MSLTTKHNFPARLRSDFENSPLITLERISTEPRSVFAIEHCPKWVRSITLISSGPDSEGPLDPRATPTEATIIIGRTHLLDVTVNLVALAILFEMTRYGGIWVHTNSNGAKPHPGVYARMAFPNERGKLLDVRPILFGANPGLATKAVWRPNDYSPENTRTEPDGHAQRDARALALGHVAQAAYAEASNPAAFLQNLQELLGALDCIRDGTNP